QAVLAPREVPAATPPPLQRTLTVQAPPRPPRPHPVRPVLRAVPTPAAEALPTVSLRPARRGPIEPEPPSSAKRDDRVVVDPLQRDQQAAIAPVSARQVPAQPTPVEETAVEKTDTGTIERPSAPVIRVTIGRIEVRAVAPPSPPEPRRASPPALSLEEYL